MNAIGSTILTLIIIFGLYMILRNNEVARERRRILDLIFERAKAEPDPSWRRFYDRFEKVSYETMVFHFWKPVNSFFDEDELLK